MNQKGWLKNDIYIHGMAWQGLAGQGKARELSVLLKTELY